MLDHSSSIQVSCQQTRFHIAEGADNKEVSLELLSGRPNHADRRIRSTYTT
jgi:hypothetical protein